MALFPHLVNATLTDTANASELPLGAGLLYTVVTYRRLRVVDVAVSGDAPAWFYLATAGDGTGHIWSFYLAAAGYIAHTFENPLELGSNTGYQYLYAMMNSNSAGTRFDLSFSGELYY